MTLYEILGVNRFATSQEIRNAYLALSKINYPKLQDGNSFKFKLISRPYRMLSNKDKRKIYDMTNNVNMQKNQVLRKVQPFLTIKILK